MITSGYSLDSFMYRPLSIFIGLRYTRAKSQHHFLSLISFISMGCIAIGVIALITILSVLNGFDREIKKQIFGMIAPITVISYYGQIKDWENLETKLAKHPQVTGIAPFAFGQALITNSNLTEPALITGILPEQEKSVSDLADKMVEGNFNSLLEPNSILLGDELAKKLKVSIGDEIIVGTPQNDFTTSNLNFRFKKFVIRGLFHAGGAGFAFDSHYAFIHLNTAQTLFNLGQAVSALHINIHDIYDAPLVAHSFESMLSADERASNWTEQLGHFFENIRLTKTIMFFIFILIITVAIFNLICTMVLVVKSKQADIAILRTLGASPGTILLIFVVQGTAIGLGGTLFGILGGVLLSWQIPALSTWLQNVLNLNLISSNVYFVNYLPSELIWTDVGMISLMALTLSLLATLYPAWQAARLAPAKILKCE